MESLRKPLMWLWMLTKRLYKKPAFLVLLLLIPLLTLGYKATTAQESGVLTIVLAQEGTDPVATDLIQELLDSSQLIRYATCNSAEEAKSLVAYGKADAAWIFPEDVTGRLAKYIATPAEKNAIATVIQREDSVLLRLAREQLSGTLYGQLARGYYLNYIRTEFPQITVSDQEVMAYFDNTQISDELFHFKTEGTAQETSGHYLLTPIRGLLAVVMALCGLSAAMFYCKDLVNGTFCQFPQRKQLLPEITCQTVAVGNVGAMVLLTLMLTHLGGNFWKELLVLVLYMGCVISFSMLLRRLLGNIRWLAGFSPLIVVIMLILCPVFFDLGALRPFQYLLPPTYFINAIYSTRWLLLMPVYTLVSGGLCWLLRRMGRK